MNVKLAIAHIKFGEQIHIEWLTNEKSIEIENSSGILWRIPNCLREGPLSSLTTDFLFGMFVRMERVKYKI